MIYRKDANFPYPILTNTSSSYETSEFVLDVEMQENVRHYRFDFSYEIDSEFINPLLKQGKAQLILVIQSKDNKFYRLDLHQTHVDIAKSRISINNRTSIQMFIQSKEEINFRDNLDLSPFYQEFKAEIIVPKYSVLGYSNIVLFDGSFSKPLDLFEKKLDPTLSSDIKIDLGSETIIINYKNEELQFNSLPKSGTLNHPYIYMGLQKALLRFIANYGSDEEQVDLDEVDPPNDKLDFKLYNLMRSKMVSELRMNTIDEVIYNISDRILEKYSAAVKELASNGN
ncbi:hypothetical protein [Bacillus rubiinfantis]|uniref:hypothetical protein n=1 Tax=Bacillus rubiinfantis TaxID=1499680 RepID=UPI0005A7B9E8|nr:hypothetical protein [Bacillus rubiinfantis]